MLSKIKEILILTLLFNVFSIYSCLDDSSILLFQFKTKGLQREDIDEEFEPMWESDTDYPYVPPEPVYNSSKFINEWFYNGMYTVSDISTKRIESYINMENSKLSIDQCNVNRVYSKSTLTPRDYNYRPKNSETYSEKNDQMGNDIFTFVGDLRFRTTTKIGETKGNGLDFYFNKKNNDDNTAICGNIGLNLNNLDQTNLIKQLKQKNYINKYIWTLEYQTEEDGIFVLGTEPHFYKNDTYYMSQFCQIKPLPQQSKDTAWSFKMDQVYTYDKNHNKVSLKNTKVDFLIDRGLIIGTDEYKKKIDELVFNDLIEKKICYREINRFKDEEKNTNDEYYIYYCNLNSFEGNKNAPMKEYYRDFPSLDFYLREANMTFSLNNNKLFHELYSRVYFLVVFKKSNTENDIWKLGEPFFIENKFTFDFDKKIVGFYNSKLEKIPNEEYMNNNLKKKDKKSSNKLKIGLTITLIIILIGVLVVLAYFLGKKLNEQRKQRANELNEDFDYSAENRNGKNGDTKQDDLLIN